MSNSFDVIVVGGGHAGVEAAHAAARLGARTALITMSVETIAQMSCNPAIGGLGKGQIVREIDALGGLMGLAIDATGIQFRMLNRSKGPAVWGPRAQADKWKYQEKIRALLAECPNLTILEDSVADIQVKEGKVKGVICESGSVYAATAVILTTGTFLRGLMHLGTRQWAGGRYGEPAANQLSGGLERIGLKLGRLKTGTPARIRAGSINYGVMQPQPGDAEPEPFSFLNDRIEQEQVNCWITYTNERTHQIIKDNLESAPLYTGQIQSTGPRYCPSIETKIIRFAEKTRHQLFLEPEGRDSEWIYCNGISTSLPPEVQDQMIHSIAGLVQAEILRYGYAIEYDYVPPQQIRATLESKAAAGLFLAGQINGTSGYEEAGGQGLLAGVNAARYCRKEEMVTLGRDQCYIGVMIDDLVTRGVDEPYRMFTSRAEYRLLLRGDNADERLTPVGRRWGLVDDKRWQAFERKQGEVRELTDYLQQKRLEGKTLAQWIRQQEKDGEWLITQEPELAGKKYGKFAFQQAINNLKYSGYVEKQLRLISRFQKMEEWRLPKDMDYGTIPQLRQEARERLNQFQPLNLGQASRISGITPSDITVLMIFMDQKRGVGK